MASVVPMTVDDAAGPLNAAYLDSLSEPWKTMAEQALREDQESDNSSVVERLDKLELAIRSQFLELVASQTGNTIEPPLYEVTGNFWKAALELCLHIVHFASQIKDDKNDDHDDKFKRYFQMNPRKIPLILLEDALDTLPVDQMQKLWAHYVEPYLDSHLMGETLWKTSTACHLQFLKVCSTFLRAMDRDSQSHNQEWKGRVLWALSKGFTIADRSALKAWGSYHSGGCDADGPSGYDSQEIFDQATVTTHTTASTVSYNLYEAFWSLQADFGNPNKIKVAQFIKKVKLVLEALESAASRKEVAISSAPTSDSLRYLTAASLLPTQLTTPSIRCSLVSQFLITASHLSSESPALSNALTPYLTRAKKLLQSDNPELYRLLCESILIRGEMQWRQWKKNKCPVKEFVPGFDSKTTSGNNDALLGTSSLSTVNDDASRIANMYHSLTQEELYEAAEECQRKVPSLESHLEEYVEALDPESGIEAEYHPSNDALFSWRAMRLFSRHQLGRLKHCREPADLERITRQLYSDQGKPIPGEMPPISEEEESDEEEGQPADQDVASEDEAAVTEDKNDTVAVKENNEAKKDSTPAKEDVNMEDATEEKEESDVENVKEELTFDDDHDKGGEGREVENELAEATKSDPTVEETRPKTPRGESQEKDTRRHDDERPPQRRYSDKKRKRSRSPESGGGRGGNKMTHGPPPREDDREGSRSRDSVGRPGDGGGRRQDHYRGDGRRDDRHRGDDIQRDSGRRGDGGRRGEEGMRRPPPPRDEGPPRRGSSGRGRGLRGGEDNGPRGRGDRRHEDSRSPMRGDRGGDRREDRGGDRGGDRRGEDRRGGGDRRRGGRDFRGGGGRR